MATIHEQENKTMEDYPVKEEREVRHGLFWFYVPKNTVHNGVEQVILTQSIAYHGDVVQLYLDSDVERADQFDCCYSEEVTAERQKRKAATAPPPSPEPEGDAEEIDVELADLPHEDLVDWLMSTGMFDGQKKPTVQEVLDGAGDNPDLAKRILTAEQEASGGEPRQGVVTGLNDVVAKASA